MRIVLSPCLYMRDTQDFYLCPLEETLEFADEFLDACLDDYDQAFYSDKRFYQPPVCEYNEYFMYQKTQKHIKNLLMNGKYVKIPANVKYSINNKNYKIVDISEFQIICNYISFLSDSDIIDKVIMFVGDKNNNDDLSCVNIDFENNKIVEVPISKNPWEEKSDVFDSYIKISNKTGNDIFPNSRICIKLDDKMKQEIKLLPENSKKTVYKKYGKIIAHRNGYSEYYPVNPYYDKTDYYKSNNGKYIISVDTLHGTFEIFDEKSTLWINEYNFSGKAMYENLTQKEMNKIRQDHKLLKN